MERCFFVPHKYNLYWLYVLIMSRTTYIDCMFLSCHVRLIFTACSYHVTYDLYWLHVLIMSRTIYIDCMFLSCHVRFIFTACSYHVTYDLYWLHVLIMSRTIYIDCMLSCHVPFILIESFIYFLNSRPHF